MNAFVSSSCRPDEAMVHNSNSSMIEMPTEISIRQINVRLIITGLSDICFVNLPVENN